MERGDPEVESKLLEEFHIKMSGPGRKEGPNREDEAHNGTISSPERRPHHGELEVGARKVNAKAQVSGKTVTIMDQRRDGIARSGMTVGILQGR